MSARDRLEFVLLKYFSGTEDVTRESAGELERLQASGLVDDFAHELAEQIRGMDAGVIRMAGRRVSDVDVVADLIDPEETS